ncbi:MatE family protein [Tritrichomonas foetus]|uniref:MatE family protein n=1 Tax=Tritrichomonas foetus TaxID=1144522 RepID=A0A1J4KV27_9EUKA|nr:MatE family protein [Tritrichomonas foetus]|eukprot:OHT15087.1 MatE family protein [Tritrichomonas foetus]
MYEEPYESSDSLPRADGKDQQIDEEHMRLGGYPPFQTICRLTIGPLLSQVIQSLYGLMNSFWISRTIGEKGMTVMSIIVVVDFINTAFAQYFNVCMSARISFLFGRGIEEHAPQVVVDLHRFCFIVGILVPAILLPLSKPLMVWYGANDEIERMGFEYLLPQLCCSFVNFSYLSLCGLLQAMGHSLLFGICQITSAILNMAVFDPLFLVGLKTGMWGASTATVLANLLPALFIYIRVFCGKFNVKPKFHMYFRKFDRHSFSAMRVSLSQLISNLAASIPVLLLAKYVAQSGAAIGKYEVYMAAWNVNDRLYAFTICVCNALNQGFLPAASFAYGCNRLNRLLRLGLYALLLGSCWSVLCCIVIQVFTKHISGIWGNDPEYLKASVKMLRIGYFTCFLNQGAYTITACLQAMKMVVISVLTSVFTYLIPLPVFSSILYFTDKKNPERLMYAYVCNNIWSFLVVMVIAFVKLRFLFKSKPSGSGVLNDTDKTKIDDPEETNTEKLKETQRLTISSSTANSSEVVEKNDSPSEASSSSLSESSSTSKSKSESESEAKSTIEEV